VRDAPTQGVDGGALVRVQGVVGHCGRRRGDQQNGALVRVQGVAGHRGRRRGERAGRPHQRAVRGPHTGQVVWHRGGRIGRCAEGDEESEQGGALVRAQFGGPLGLLIRINMFDVERGARVRAPLQASEKHSRRPGSCRRQRGEKCKMMLVLFIGTRFSNL
jgi:hypothetical protein